MRIFACALSLLLWSPVGAAQPPDIGSIQQWHKAQTRVEAIARRILAENLSDCPERQTDFGMVVVWPNPLSPPDVQAAWAKALGLGVGATIIRVFPNSPAADLGLQAGDDVIAVDDVVWSTKEHANQPFIDAFSVFMKKGEGSLRVGRQNAVRDVHISGQPVCRAFAILNRTNKVNAFSQGTQIVVEAGMEKLLDSDDELAFVIAHEAAHVFLGHVAPDKKMALRERETRLPMEMAADALGVQMMARAGFAPEAAPRAFLKLDKAMRGPLTRLLDLHGPYLSSDERLAFLKEQARIVRSGHLKD